MRAEEDLRLFAELKRGATEACELMRKAALEGGRDGSELGDPAAAAAAAAASAPPRDAPRVSEALEAMHAMSASLKQRVDGEILAREIDQMRKVNDFLSEELTEKSLKHSKELSDLYFEMLRVKSHALSLEAQLVVAKRP